MTQTIREVTPEARIAPTPIPRQRRTVSVPELVAEVATDLVAAPDVQPDEAAPAPVRPDRGRPSVGWWVGVDMVLALVLAAAGAAFGMLSLPVAMACAVGWPLLLLAVGHYAHPRLGSSHAARLHLVLGTGLRAAVLALAVSPLLHTADVVALVAFLAILSVASAVPPLLTLRTARPRIVLAGRPRDVREVMAELASSDTQEVVAACLTRTSKVSLGELPTYLGFDDFATVAHRHGADAVVVLPGARLTHAEVRRLHWSLSAVGAELYLGTGLLDVAPQRTRVLAAAGLDVLHVKPAVLGGPRRVVKDVVERVLALGAFVVLLPLLAVLCLAVRLESPGPALFRQERVGRNGVPFTMLKLRSMRADAEVELEALADANEKDAVLFKIVGDPRITRLGAKLRRYSLDELPQLWNVVRGDMSLVGPRPALPREVAQYDHDPRRRLVVKPGVTGLWQVSGRSELTWDESVRLDLKYVDNWSLGLDLRILVRTVRAVLGHRGAY